MCCFPRCMIQTQAIWLAPIKNEYNASQTGHYCWVKVLLDDDLAGNCHMGDVIQVFGDVRVSFDPSAQPLKTASQCTSKEEVMNKRTILLGLARSWNSRSVNDLTWGI